MTTSLSPSFRSPVVGLSPFPRFWRVSHVFTVCFSLFGDQYIAGCPCHYSMHIGYYGVSVTVQESIPQSPA